MEGSGSGESERWGESLAVTWGGAGKTAHQGTHPPGLPSALKIQPARTHRGAGDLHTRAAHTPDQDVGTTGSQVKEKGRFPRAWSAPTSLWSRWLLLDCLPNFMNFSCGQPDLLEPYRRRPLGNTAAVWPAWHNTRSPERLPCL